jgi:outer membrane protein OmpA-like peptidoglycan-associated protein
MKILNLVVMTAMAALLAACMNTVVTTTAAVDPFNEALHKGYNAFAAEERKEYDWINGEHFARKANAAAAGQRVLPEVVSDWSLTAPAAAELSAARARLMAALDGGGRTTYPADAAEAQVAFDCWIEEQEEGWETAGIKACKDRFEAAMLRMGGAVANVYLVFFDFDRSNISPVAQRVLEKVVADAAKMNPSRVTVAGNADRSGSDGYNLALSKRRAETVAAALTRAGVARAKLQVEWFGESRPRVKTADGVREPENRNVEIRFVK